MSGYLAVAQVKKPHGLKGEVLAVPLTDHPREVFVPGRSLVPLNQAGEVVGGELVIERARPYQRRWLMKFEGLESREGRDLKEVYLGADREELTPPADGEMYLHEVEGCEVVVGGRVIGVAREILRAPGSELLAVTSGDKEVLIPFRRPFVVGLDREDRRIRVDPPPGLLDL